MGNSPEYAVSFFELVGALVIAGPIIYLIGHLISFNERTGVHNWRRYWNFVFDYFFVRHDDGNDDVTSSEDNDDFEELPQPTGSNHEPSPVRAGSVAENRGSDPRTSSEWNRTITVVNPGDIIMYLALLQKPDGSWALSGNKIHAAVGGTRQDVLKEINRARGEGKDSPPAGMYHIPGRPGKYAVRGDMDDVLEFRRQNGLPLPEPVED